MSFATAMNGPPRPPSLRSVASARSARSALAPARDLPPTVTRARSRTVTGAPVASTSSGPVPEMPDYDEDVDDAADATCVSDGLSPRTSRRVGTGTQEQVQSLTLAPTDMPSAFTRRPSLQRIDLNFRDSVITQDSSVSSSIYPPSTSTASGDTTPSPRSFSFAERECSSIDHSQDFDGDDVSYRLRLLVKNNYWLPPAHSKPNPSDLAVQSAKKPARLNTPTFLDLFRIGKTKSKPGTPDSSSSSCDSPSPALRTPSDAPLPPRSTPQTPRIPPRPATSPADSRSRPGRVVVVREKMDDVMSAAKAAEHEIKTKGGGDDAPANVFDGIVDPTDAVDVPPPSSTYFAVQASEAHGLGVEDSVGAALLADRLPPSHSPSLDPDNAWRKQLLHAAVDLSLSGSPESSRLPSPAVPSWPTSSLPSSPAPPPSKAMLDRRIIRHPVMMGRNPSEASIRSLPARTMKRSNTPSKDSMQPGYVPERASTPSGPFVALAPAPRSMSDRERPRAATTDQVPTLNSPRPSTSTTAPSSMANTRSLRKIASSPHLSQASSSVLMMTPPPIPGQRRGASTAMSNYSEGRPESRAESTYYSDAGMRSITRSPATSAFHTARNDEWQSSFLEDDSDDEVDDSRIVLPPSEGKSSPMTASLRSMPRISVEHAQVSTFQPEPRTSSFTPPPRSSTSSSHFFALSPPPRRPPRKGSLLAAGAQPASTSAEVKPLPISSTSVTRSYSEPTPRESNETLSRSSRSNSASSQYSASSRLSASPSGRYGMPEILAPDPTTPPFPRTPPFPITPPAYGEAGASVSPTSPMSTSPPFSTHRLRAPGGMSLEIPTGYVPPDIHSAPPRQSTLPITSHAAPSLHIAPPTTSPQSFFDAIQDQAFAEELAEEEEEDDSELSSEEDDVYSTEAHGSVYSGQTGSTHGSAYSGYGGRASSTYGGRTSSAHGGRTSSAGHSTESRAMPPPPAFPRARAESATARTSPRPAFMRFGNHSSPHVGAALVSPALAGIQHDRRQPVENKVTRTRRFFTDLRSEPGHSGTPYGVAHFAASRTSQRPATATASLGMSTGMGSSAAGVGMLDRPMSEDGPKGRGLGEPVSLVRRESLMRLDGMLQRHIAAEKEAMKRITSTARDR
ncbi:hypothetical protein BD626DRAFT_490690 [Schizophyllum amplum]|uniref:Uncharacterized protein n=1 Tax=Schizophyllum amplum TaxID=97359 RepID=A0A550CJU0_9AGAR|nr:hypothetical protein BD626DRAFT_490690 [Auriculariopsis ampla]